MYVAPLSQADRVMAVQQLAEARAAYHKLLIGGQAVEIVTQGDVVKFTRADADRLAAYIRQLVDLIDGKPTGGAIRFVFAP